MEIFNHHQLNGMARILAHERILSASDAIHFQAQALEKKLSLPRYLTHHHILTARQIALVTAKHLSLPFVDLTEIQLESCLNALLYHPFFLMHDLLPVSLKNHQLAVATDDPCSAIPLQDIHFHTGFQAHYVIVETDKLQALNIQLRHRRDQKKLFDSFEQLSAEANRQKDDVSMITLVNQILLEAVKNGASDVHFEPYETHYRIRYRQDGLLLILATPPIELFTRMVARIKIMAEMDISEKRAAQDGRFHFTHDNTVIHARVSTCPTVCGEKIVIRLLNPHVLNPNFETLGLSPSQTRCLQHVLRRSQGMILVTGPTGSGKSMTLYSALNMLNTQEKNICAVEDPVELKIAGINQVNVNMKTAFTFAHALRTFLRQDPDVIMIGEMRDLETTDTAIKAALTGHLVLSTMHTNSATDTLTRLNNMGIESFNIASAVSLIIAQRLIRRLCEQCKTKHEYHADHLKTFGLPPDVMIYQAQGCKQCVNGYQGRLGIFEMLVVSKTIAALILTKKHASEIQRQAEIEGMQTLYQAGLEHVKNGHTTLEELNRITVE